MTKTASVVASSRTSTNLIRLPPEATTFLGGKLPQTHLPWYAVNVKDPQDQLYTKRDVAKHCFKVFKETAKANGYDLRNHTYIEPSAGEGCFTDLLPAKNRVALDIDPKSKGICKADFLCWTPKRGKYAVIGNPPFGVRGATALAFINRAGLFADIVGFILPMTFTSNGKGGAMTRVERLRLLHSEELPSNSFYSGNGNERGINTVFQVWGARDLQAAADPPTCDSYAQIFTVCTNPSRRCGTHRMGEYDLFLQGTFYENKPPKVVTDFADVKYGSGYGIIIHSKRREIMRILRNTDWVSLSSRATNHCRHIRMHHIRTAIIEGGFQDR